MSKYTFLALLLLLCSKTTTTRTIEGWIYVDNWFEFYFNGEKVATDPISFKPQNAVKISFNAPISGLYSFAIYAKDFADDITGLEYNNTCLGDGGIRISLSDGTVSNTDWKCFIAMQGPINPIECGINNDCTTKGSQCIVQYNETPICWNQTICDMSNLDWMNATEYIDERQQSEKQKNVDNDVFDCGDIECAHPMNINWTQYGQSKFIWSSDLDYHNRIICRYQYYVDAANIATHKPNTSKTQNIESLNGNVMDNEGKWMIVSIVFIILFVIVCIITILVCLKMSAINKDDRESNKKYSKVYAQTGK
eukprot:49417_1